MLIFLLQYWRVLTVLAVLAATFTGGYRLGGASARSTCEKILQAEHDGAERRRNELQAAANKKAEDYEKARAAAGVRYATTKRRLADAQKNNSSFGSCHAGPEWLRLYTETARSGADR